jgi:catechol 2,3-dioxygenase-like lactoylglutathione lyase family enzyme
MEAIIANLLNCFERGALSRRSLIQGLAMLAAAGGMESEGQVQNGVIVPSKIDHVSIQVADLPGSIAFYQKMFGLALVSEDKPNEIVRLGAGKVLVSLHHKTPTGVVDHFAIGVQNFNKDVVAKELKLRGANPEENLDAGFHIKDPQGIGVQIVAA